ncbi:MAG TPA: transposase [Solirubrobacteraceae bacterium]|nr:transposase [Solirubrobacteraceae bacterium]
MARPGHERFTEPMLASQRRYEALRAYFVEERSPGEVAERFGYSKGSVQTLISSYRSGDLGGLFAQSRPGPKSQPKKDAARERVIALRRERHGIEEIVAELARAGSPLSRTAVWEVLAEAGLSRMPRPAAPPASEPAPERLAAPKVRVLGDEDWPSAGVIQTQHAGLFLLLPELVELDLPGLVKATGWPSTSQLSALRSVLSLLALKLSGRRRRSHVASVVHDPALGLFAGLNVLPKTWHLSTYSYRTARAQQLAFFEALQPRLRDAGLFGEQGLNLDFHTIMSYGQDTILEKNYVPRRSQRTRSVLTFIAQDAQQHTIIYANAELTARQQSGEVIEFARFYERTHGQLPKLLVFDGKLTTHEHLAELDEIGVGFITLRQRSPKQIAALQSLPQGAWTKTRLDRSGKHKTAAYHETPVTIKGRTLRQIAVNGLGREQATLILTNQKQSTVKQLIERYGQRWGIENQLAEQIRAFHLDSLCSQVPLAVDFDVALTILADIAYRRFAKGLHAAYHNQTPDTIRDYLINGIGELRFNKRHIDVALRRRTHTPALLDAGYQDRQTEVPWWGGRTLTYSFPAR